MKQKQKRKHLEKRSSPQTPQRAKKPRGSFNLQENILQYTQMIRAPTGDQKEQDTSSSLNYSCFSYEKFISSEGCPPPCGPSGLAQGCGQTTGSSECISMDKHIHKECHMPHKTTPKKPIMVPAWNPEAEENSSASVYFSCVSSANKLTPIEKDECHMPHETTPKKPIMVPAWNPEAEENSSASVYFSCVSSANKLTPIEKDECHKLHPCAPFLESHEMPLRQNLKDLESSSPFPLDYFPAYLDNKLSTSSAPVEKERIMKVYYMYVRMKRGVAVLPDTEGFAPPQKKMKLKNIMFPEKIYTEVHPSDVLTNELLSDSEFSLNSETQEEKEEAHNPTDPMVFEESSRAKTPEWLVALDHGYRCMACCRVFPNLETLQYHVEHGIKEGFSCHAFHEALACLKDKKKKAKRKRRKKMNIKSKKYRSMKEKLCDMSKSLST